MDMETIYRLYFRDVYLFLQGLTRSETLAEELTQETFFKALDGLKNFDGKQDVRAWLFTVARNCYYSRCRKAKHTAPLEAAETQPLAFPGKAQQQVLAAHVAVAQLRRALLGQTEGRLGPLGKSGLVHVPLTSSVPAPRKAYPVLLDVLHPLCHAPSPLFCAGVGCSEAPRPAPGSGSRRPPCEMARICPWKTAPPPVDRILFFPTMKKYTHSRGNLALQFSKVMVQ